MTLEQKHDGSEGVSHSDIWEKSVPGRGVGRMEASRRPSLQGDPVAVTRQAGAEWAGWEE